jgi:hypothetical protein
VSRLAQGLCCTANLWSAGDSSLVGRLLGTLRLSSQRWPGRRNGRCRELASPPIARRGGRDASRGQCARDPGIGAPTPVLRISAIPAVMSQAERRPDTREINAVSEVAPSSTHPIPLPPWRYGGSRYKSASKSTRSPSGARRTGPCKRLRLSYGCAERLSDQCGTNFRLASVLRRGASPVAVWFKRTDPHTLLVRRIRYVPCAGASTV